VSQTLESRVEELTARVESLELQLKRLMSRVGEVESEASPHVRGHEVTPAALDDDYPLGEPADVSEEVLSWAGRASLLPRLSTLCFLLVVALILRTITDAGLVNSLVGSGLGMGFAAVQMVVGWYKYGKQSPLAPVFAACGAVLMSTIVVETHMHFQSLPLVPAYLTLMATGIGMALISRQYNTFIPISVGILGMCFAGAAIDYPHPFFPYLSLVLLTANLLGYFAAQLKRCSWLRWSVLVVTMVMLQLWAFRLGMAVSRGETPAVELAPAWFLPTLAVFCTTYVLLAVLGIMRSGTSRISRFDFMLPTLNALWAFTAAQYVISAGKGNVYLLGCLGIILGVGHLAAMVWLARRATVGAPGTNTFAFAGATLLALGLPSATGSFMMTLPVLAIVAVVMAILSRIWENGGVRVTTYVINMYCCIGLVVMLQGESARATDALAMLPAGILAYLMIYHYQWCRRWPPPASSSIFSRFDSKDRSAVALLLAGLVCSFFMMRIGLYHAMQMVPADLQRDMFRCAQSVLINGAAICIILFAYLRRNREIRNVAILVTLVGGVKVFLYDLLGTHGLPLVFSVFSFGLAAAIESVALGKWMKEQPVQSEEQAAACEKKQASHEEQPA